MYKCVIPFIVRDTRKHKETTIQIGEKFRLQKAEGDIMHLKGKDDLVIYRHNLLKHFIEER